jgi:hypothetical protein
MVEALTLGMLTVEMGPLNTVPYTVVLGGSWGDNVLRSAPAHHCFPKCRSERSHCTHEKSVRQPGSAESQRGVPAPRANAEPIFRSIGALRAQVKGRCMKSDAGGCLGQHEKWLKSRESRRIGTFCFFCFLLLSAWV